MMLFSSNSSALLGRRGKAAGFDGLPYRGWRLCCDSIDHGGGKRRSDIFFGENLDDSSARTSMMILPRIARRISHRTHLGAHLIAGERSENSIADFRHFAPHNVVAPTAIVATNVQRVKRPHSAPPA
jgi:hypothetical protein